MNPLNNTAASNSATQSYVNQARQQGQQLQNQWNTQTTQDQGQYNQAVNNTQNAYNNLSNFSNNVGNYAQKYTNQMQNAYGYNPSVTQGLESAYLPTLQQVTKLNEAYANAPKEAQQMANYGGVTAGAMANNLSNLASNLAQGQAGANAQLSGLSNGINSQSQLAGVVSGAANQELSTKQAALNNVYTQANQQMATASQTMNNIEQLAANQGNLTAQQVTAYETARSTYISNRATAAQAYAQAEQLNLQNKQMQNYMNSGVYKSNMSKGEAYNPVTGQWTGGNTNNTPKFQKYSPGKNGKPATQSQLQQWAKKIMTGSTVQGPTGIASLLNPGASSWFNSMNRPGAFMPNFPQVQSNTSLGGLFNSILGI